MSSSGLFPILPAESTSKGQMHQSSAQIQSILALPPNLLVQLARTEDPLQLQSIIHSQGATDYLPSMLLPPPSPGSATLSTAYSDATHPGIPFLLHRRFSPHTAGILAVATEPIVPYTPTYASVEEWARAEAQHLTRQQQPPAQVAQVTAQLARWAAQKEEQDVQQAVDSVKHTAVSLAARVAWEQKVYANAGSKDQQTQVDLSAYAEHYRRELK
jgi:hypothetical protein